VPTGRVNDYAGLLRPAEREQLESRLAERERATGAQVVVAIFPSLEGESLEDYSIRLAQKWRIGQKSLDNGVILLIFVNDRKMRLEVGYGLEPVIPDIVAGALIRETLAPRFREQRYAAGIEASADAIYARIAGDTRAPPPRPPAQGRPLPLATLLLLLLIFGVFGVAILSAMRNASRGAVTAGGRGWRSHPPIFYGGGGGWSSGGGGGGGFSGGGGSFGGGGASGSW
jgi:uncharacterized protein